jgi:hypothetical protein
MHIWLLSLVFLPGLPSDKEIGEAFKTRIYRTETACLETARASAEKNKAFVTGYSCSGYRDL